MMYVLFFAAAFIAILFQEITKNKGGTYGKRIGKIN
jgi:hypothetical protein